MSCIPLTKRERGRASMEGIECKLSDAAECMQMKSDNQAEFLFC